MKFGAPRGRRHLRAKCRENLAYRSSAITDGLIWDSWPAVACTGFRLSTAVSKWLVRLTWNFEHVERASSCLCRHNFIRIVRIAARIREQRTDDAARRSSVCQRPVANYGRNRSAERIVKKFGMLLRTTGFQWPAKFERNLSSRFETADDARNPLPANPQPAIAGTFLGTFRLSQRTNGSLGSREIRRECCQQMHQISYGPNEGFRNAEWFVIADRSNGKPTIHCFEHNFLSRVLAVIADEPHNRLSRNSAGMRSLFSPIYLPNCIGI